MKLIKQSREAAVPSPSPIFEGTVRTQNLVAGGDAALLRVTAVTFEDGARNKLHRHTTDQVLVVTDGRGIVATEEEELRVGPGDVILIPAGERHWHGAEPGQTFTHLSILTPGEMTIEESSEGRRS
jgi:quercetin dioxygenase-like cupin family protein